MFANAHKRLLRAIYDGQIERVKECLDAGADIETREHKIDRYRGMSALSLAIARGQGAIAQLLVERGANMEDRAFRNDPAFLLAAKGRMPELAGFLLDRGADIEMTDHYGRTALMAAAGFGHKDMAAFLLGRGANPRFAAKDGETALHRAAHAGDLEIAALLLDSGAEIDAQADDGATPLLKACAYNDNRVDIARLLLERGADAQLRNKQGRTALDLAQMHRMQRLEKLLIAHEQSGGVKWERVSERAVKRLNIIDEDYTQLEHLDFGTRMYTSVMKSRDGHISHVSQSFNYVARDLVESAAAFLREKGGSPGAPKTPARRPRSRTQGF
jgi:ankyrin repeat protein